ncbi:hypothetical protein D3C84_1003280 [compost metagenome]
MYGKAHRQRIRIAQTLGGRGINAVLHSTAEHCASDDGLSDQDVVPGQYFAAIVEADARTVQVHRAVVAAFDVVLAAPKGAHRHV